MLGVVCLYLEYLLAQKLDLVLSGDDSGFIGTNRARNGGNLDNICSDSNAVGVEMFSKKMFY